MSPRYATDAADAVAPDGMVADTLQIGRAHV